MHGLDDIVDPDQGEQLMEEIELLDGASVDFDQEQVSKGNYDTGIFWFCADKLWCGDISGTFPQDDNIATSESIR